MQMPVIEVGERGKRLGLANKQTRPDTDGQPFKIDGVYCKLIPLTQGQFAIVDAADYGWLMQWTWQAVNNKKTKAKKFYAFRNHCIAKVGKNWIRVPVKMHRAILDYHEIPLGKLQGDHVNGLGLDNRKKNLRPVNRHQQMMNLKMSSLNKTGAKGVITRRDRKGFFASIRSEGTSYSIRNPENGSYIFPDLESAKDARLWAEMFLHREFARPEIYSIN